MIPTYWEAAKAHLRAVDPVMAAVIDAYESAPPVEARRLSDAGSRHRRPADIREGGRCSVDRFVAEMGKLTPSCILEKSWSPSRSRSSFGSQGRVHPKLGPRG